MEINKFEEVHGVVATEEIPEGHMCLLVPHTETYGYGSREDLVGVKLPDTTDEAAKARFCITHAVTNIEPPIYEPYPTISDTSLRYGFDQAANVPFTATLHLTPPSMAEGVAIPSGALALAFGPGMFTVPSGAWMYDASVVKGDYLSVTDAASDGAADAGKLELSATASFAEVIEVASNGDLTFHLIY